MFKFSLLIFFIAICTLANEGAEPEAGTTMPDKEFSGSQTQKWSEVQAELSQLKSKIDAQTKTVEELLLAQKHNLLKGVFFHNQRPSVLGRLASLSLCVMRILPPIRRPPLAHLFRTASVDHRWAIRSPGSHRSRQCTARVPAPSSRSFYTAPRPGRKVRQTRAQNLPESRVAFCCLR